MIVFCFWTLPTLQYMLLFLPYLQWASILLYQLNEGSLLWGQLHPEACLYIKTEIGDLRKKICLPSTPVTPSNSISSSSSAMQAATACSLLFKSALAALYLLSHASKKSSSSYFWDITKVLSPSLKLMIRFYLNNLHGKVFASFKDDCSLIRLDSVLHNGIWTL